MVSSRIGSLVLLALSVCVSLSCQESRNRQMPDHLIGIWVTTHPKYQDRYFEFTSDATMVVGKGDGLEDVYPIENIEASPQNALTRYTVTYLSEGEEYHFHFFYDPFEDGMIRFVNQEGLNWTREEQ